MKIGEHVARPGVKEGLRDRNSPLCTLSQNGYGSDPKHMRAPETSVAKHKPPVSGTECISLLWDSNPRPPAY